MASAAGRDWEGGGEGAEVEAPPGIVVVRLGPFVWGMACCVCVLLFILFCQRQRD